MGARVRFGEFVVDVAARTVDRNGEPVLIEPQVFDVLALLVQHRDRVVSKVELLDTVWADRIVSPATLTSRIRDLRSALGDSGRRQQVIRTAHGRGFRFVATIDDDDVALVGSPGGIVTPSKPLIGRDEMLADLRRRLDACRLVTLVGPGGAGKTHLMRHAVAGREAIVTDLTDVRDGDSVVRTMLDGAGGLERTDVVPIDALAESLASRTVLLVVDNCEHVIESATLVVAELLHRCDGLRVLATSRRPLQISEESVLRVGPLDPDGATELLAWCAARHGVDVDGSSPAAALLCARLDHMPLALEIAASKTRAISLGELTRLLDDRFGLLTSDAPDLASHHTSIDTTIRWSVELLTDRQRRLLVALGVFAGPFELGAIEAVCPADDRAGLLADLVALVDVSMVQFDPDSGRYRLLESVRSFVETMGIPSEVRTRFREHVATTVEATGVLHSSSFSADLDTIRSTWPSVRAVVASARADGDVATVHRLISAVTRYAEQVHSFEVLEWAEWAMQTDETTTPPSTRLAAGLLLTHRSDFAAAATYLSHVDGAEPLTVVLARLWLHYFTGDLTAADRATAEIRELDPSGETYEGLVGAIATHFLDKGAGREIDPSAIAVVEAWASDGDPAALAGRALCVALRLDWEREAEVAIEQLTATIDTARRLGLAFLASGAMTARSIVLAIRPDAESSVPVLRATLRSYAEVGSWQFALADFAAVALALAEHGQPRAAAELLGARRGAGYVGDASADVERRAIDVTRRALGERAFDDAVRHGSARDPRTATRLAAAALDQCSSG